MRDTLEFDPETRKVTRRFPVNRAFGDSPQFLLKTEDGYDNGLESIAFVPNPGHPEGGTFFLGNQWDPPCIVEVRVPIRSSTTLEAEAGILRVLPVKLDDPAAMYYDRFRRRLNVLSDADNILLEIGLDGRVVAQYAFPGNDQEGLARDNDGYLYIAQDCGGIIKVKDLRR